MRRALFALLVVIAPAAFADDVAKGLENLANIFAIAQKFELSRALGVAPEIGQPADPWGTPYQLDFEAGRIAGAGSDRTFAEEPPGQFSGVAGDVVWSNRNFVRTNHNWLCDQLRRGAAADAELNKLRDAETMLLISRTDGMKKVFGSKVTSMTLEQMGKLIEGYRAEHGGLASLAAPADAIAVLMTAFGQPEHKPFDAWRTPLRLIVEGETYRVVSAGGDRTFKPETWSTPTSTDPADDIVFENGKFIRRLDEWEVFRASETTAEPIPQPPDRAMRDDPATRFNKLDKSITAPVVIKRVEPVYPEPYRQGRITGIVILEAAITEEGQIENLAILKSLGPAIDMAGIDAVRQWKFKPGVRDGKPIPVLFNLTINFKLN